VTAAPALRPAAFLDRDGVLNRAIIRSGKPHPPASLEELEIVPEAGEALQRLKEAGFALVVVTNQPDVARGLTPLAVVEAINQRIRKALPVDAVEMCLHDDLDGCDCRKPKPGMLTRAAERLRIDLSLSFMVGDRWRDIAAGRAAGCRTILVGEGYGERLASPPEATVATITEAVEWILESLRNGAT